MRVILVFLLFTGIVVPGFAQLTYRELNVDYDSAMQYKNLKIIPIRKKGPGTPPSVVSFAEALNTGLISVKERGTSSVENVHWLSVYNHSDKDVYISAGELLAGGRQDRMVTKDTLIRARSNRSDLHVMCIEEERWSKKDRKFIYQGKANIHLRKVLDNSRNQVLIWKEIHRQLSADTISNKTLSYLSLGASKKYGREAADYFNYFIGRFRSTDSTIVGIACVSGDKVIGTDIFESTQLFYGQLQAALRGYSEEALVYGSTVTMTDEAVKNYLDKILTNERQQEIFVKQHGKLFKSGDRVIHLTTY